MVVRMAVFLKVHLIRRRYDKLRVAIATQAAPWNIHRVVGNGVTLFAACGARILVYKRQRMVHEVVPETEQEEGPTIVDMILIRHLVVFVCEGGWLKVPCAL
jgi:hypothetical protein